MSKNDYSIPLDSTKDELERWLVLWRARQSHVSSRVNGEHETHQRVSESESNRSSVGFHHDDDDDAGTNDTIQTLHSEEKQSSKKRHSSAEESEGPSKKRRFGMSSAVDMRPSRRTKNAWTRDETMAFIEGVECFGAGRWAEIKELAGRRLKKRSTIQIKDKWPRDKQLNDEDKLSKVYESLDE
jgi:hypothetical protein